MSMIECPSLSAMRAGDMAVVEEVCGCSQDCQRLAAMGLCCGALVRMLSPGNPCAIQVGDARVVIRGDHSEAVRVSPLD